MARLARIVAPGMGHHVTQRGNRRGQIFFTDADYLTYLSQLTTYAARHGLDLLAYCLMPNHVHLVSVPQTVSALARGLRDTHAAYAVYRNRQDALSGHVWQGRFFSCVLEEAHLWSAVRYVERNPVRAGLVAQATDYRWSSAAAHAGLRHDPLLTAAIPAPIAAEDWSAWLSDEEETESYFIRQQTHSGRPCGTPSFLAHLTSLLGRPTAPGKRGPKPKPKEKPPIS